MLKYLLFFFASLYLADGATECYDCGYLIDGWKPDGNNVQHPMTDGTPQCGDEATMADRVTSCSDEGECCGVVREFFVQEATNITEEFIQVEVRHGCEKKLAEQFSDYHEFLCKSGEGTENQCFNITYDNIPEHEATFADVCFCNEDRCNKDVPVMPDPPTTTTTTADPTTTTTTSQPGLGCSDNLLFSTSLNSFPDGKLTCYDDKGFELKEKEKKELPDTSKLKEKKEEEEMFSPGTTCVFLSSGHVSSGGFIIEMFCQDSHWEISLIEL